MDEQIKLQKWQPVIGRWAAILLGLIFLLAAFSKLGDLAGFQKDLEAYSYIPYWLRGMAVLLIPGVEAVIGICLLSGTDQREAALIAAMLLIAFTGLGIYSNLVGSSGGGCGCFKVKLPPWLELNGWWTVVRNLVLVALSTAGYIWASKDAKLFSHVTF